MTIPSRVYVLSADPELAAQSELGAGWHGAWVDEAGRMLLPFRTAPDGLPTLTHEEALEYKAAHTAELTVDDARLWSSALGPVEDAGT